MLNKKHSRLFRAAAAFCALCAVFCLASCAGGAAAKSVAPISRGASLPTEGVYYSLFVRAFADGNGDGIGDFKGLTAKLDYLNDGDDTTTSDLGVTGIWLLPIFPTVSYHGYNVTDYYSVNPDYGTMEDFENLVREARKRGIDVIIDMVLNHASFMHPWFQDSMDPDSPYRNWFRWTTDDEGKYNLKQRIWGHNVWNKIGDSYYAALFDQGMPDYNASNPEVLAEFKKIAKFWLDKGVSGFRLDAASHLFNTAELPPGENGLEQSLAFWKEYADYCRSIKPDCYIVAEVWEQTSTRGAYMSALQSDFHFDMGTKIIDAVREGSGGKNNIANSFYGDYETYASYAPDYIDAPFLTNHDQNRVAGLLQGKTDLLKMAASIYMLTEGVPFIYYGEEIGMMGAKPDEQIRTPFMWGGSDRYETKWIESVYNKKTIPYADQKKDENSLLMHYRRIVRVKTGYEALYKGRMTPSDTGRSEIVSWFMESDNQRAFVMHNLDRQNSVTLEIPQIEGMIPAFFSNDGYSVEGSTVTIPALTSAVFVTE